MPGTDDFTYNDPLQDHDYGAEDWEMDAAMEEEMMAEQAEQAEAAMVMEMEEGAEEGQPRPSAGAPADAAPKAPAQPAEQEAAPVEEEPPPQPAEPAEPPRAVLKSFCVAGAEGEGQIRVLAPRPRKPLSAYQSNGSLLAVPIGQLRDKLDRDATAASAAAGAATDTAADSAEASTPAAAAAGSGALWVDKYAPRSFRELLSNEQVATNCPHPLPPPPPPLQSNHHVYPPPSSSPGQPACPRLAQAVGPARIRQEGRGGWQGRRQGARRPRQSRRRRAPARAQSRDPSRPAADVDLGPAGAR